ncbi:MAG: hypothetical protein D8M59_05205 [Planctomycetes bacterium]|nr:hypothetical protein [Planctomycetota bacterium]
MIMMPLAGLVYFITAIFGFEIPGWDWEYNRVFMLANGVTFVFVVCYWWLLWKPRTNWTAMRALATGAATLVILIISAIAGAGIHFGIGDDLGVFSGGCIAIALWLFATVFIWRETAGERIARLRATGRNPVCCPNCGYNMTGLGVSLCPECGAKYTLDELFTQQQNFDSAELT